MSEEVALVPDEIRGDVGKLLDRWVNAKRARKFEEADALRAELRSLGVEPDEARPSLAAQARLQSAANEEKLDAWVNAKRAKDWPTADALREELRAVGVDPEAVRPALPPHAANTLYAPAQPAAAFVYVPPPPPPPVVAQQPAKLTFDAGTEGKLDAWVAAKRAKDYTTADALRSELR
eukprot:CAMPEP_0119380862 /NCGR_PEP_ID=MMETSP1334-20130426/57969_1 /TAXON_ID=127549 /ORGANISM="Calcidiscus leptoporus, Strain RCC1130" /LENGTH=177 /DNA_ID=CAMNT_0007400805 /DNA_START=15 /DNA_END=544 /DNA_ORIENTATION=-